MSKAFIKTKYVDPEDWEKATLRPGSFVIDIDKTSMYDTKMVSMRIFPTSKEKFNSMIKKGDNKEDGIL